MIFWAPGTQSLKIRENRHGNCLGSRAPSFQNAGLQSSSDPPFGASVVYFNDIFSRAIVEAKSFFALHEKKQFEKPFAQKNKMP